MEHQVELLHKIIVNEVLVKNSEEQIDAYENPNAWIFDFRKILMNGRHANLISGIFYDQFSAKLPFQICALEIAGVPLAASLMNKFFYKGHENINAFFIRKSRKKTGLLRMVEGKINDDEKIVLVDDIMNGGNSFWRQITVLEELGHSVDTVWSIMRFRDLDYYERFHEKGITVKSLFTLDDFTKVTGGLVKNLPTHQEAKVSMPFEPQWLFKGKKPSYNYVLNKSQPLLDGDKVYFGTDNKVFFALNQKDGSVAWEYRVGLGIAKKSIFSNPAFYKDTIIFGSYDGNIYALNKKTGKRDWVNTDADWVGSSPAVSDDLGLVFIGLEFGLFKKHGGITAINAITGKTVWSDHTHPAFTHSSPLYIQKHKQVAIGSNDGMIRLYNAKNGKKLWEFKTIGGESFDPKTDAGFGEGDIKESFAYDAKHDFLIFGSIDGNLYIIKRKNGTLVYKHTCEFGVWSTPLIYKNRVYFTSIDKHLRCLDLDSLQLVFERNIDSTRIFASPNIINDRLYVGTNAGRLHEIDPDTGKELGYFQACERITNSVVYNEKTDTYFLPTYANEIICLKRTKEHSGTK